MYYCKALMPFTNEVLDYHEFLNRADTTIQIVQVYAELHRYLDT